jgi:hypothetical protein
MKCPRVRISQIIGSFLVFFLLSGCASYFITQNFNSKTASHANIAVLPFEVIYSGRIPVDLSEKDILSIEKVEATAFQISLYNQILRSTKSGRKPINVNVQHYRETQTIMEDAGLTWNEIYSYSPTELASLLNVDAVVKSRVEKERFLTDLESYGMEMGIRLAEIISQSNLYPWLPPFATRAKKIYSDFTLLDKENGSTLWQFSFEVDADWRSPSNEIVDEITRKAAKRFPYRME